MCAPRDNLQRLLVLLKIPVIPFAVLALVLALVGLVVADQVDDEHQGKVAVKRKK